MMSNLSRIIWVNSRNYAIIFVIHCLIWESQAFKTTASFIPYEFVAKTKALCMNAAKAALCISS